MEMINRLLGLGPELPASMLGIVIPASMTDGSAAAGGERRNSIAEPSPTETGTRNLFSTSFPGEGGHAFENSSRTLPFFSVTEAEKLKADEAPPLSAAWNATRSLPATGRSIFQSKEGLSGSRRRR